MKKVVFSLFLSFILIGANAADIPSQRRGQLAVSSDADTNSTVTSARAAVRSVAQPVSTASSDSSIRKTSARSATPAISNIKQPTVSARAATNQKVLNSGTKIASASTNILVDDACLQQFNGCMDSFCIIGNDNGGRCQCSDKKSELDSILSEIENLDSQSYKMATEGVERIEMGSDAEIAIAAANKTANEIMQGEKKEKNTRKSLDLSLWETTNFESEENIFDQDASEDITNKTGNALYSSALNLCASKIPACSKNLDMLKMMYSQSVKSDCNAYENELKTRKNASSQKLAAAQKALRESALESYKSANKFDLGQCTIEFKKCMTTTAGCKDDFTGCVGIAAAQNATASVGAKSSAKQYSVKGKYSKISIAASTMDTLLAKKPLCESVTNSCVTVKDKVWDTFLADIAPSLKSAELTAESDLRTNCISNISECIQKACKDTIDPNDPDGSFDMCLSRPETVRSLCKVQIDPCQTAEPQIMDFVYARLSAMRVDACTKEAKSCFTDQDRCGENFENCIGLDIDDIKQMCPVEKLVACQENGELSSIDSIDNLIQGIYLGVDNSALEQCQKAADESMITVCGDTDNCDSLVVDENLGKRTLNYQVCVYNARSIEKACYDDIALIPTSFYDSTDTVKFKVNGQIEWGKITFDSEGKLSITDETGFADNVKTEVSALQNAVDMAMTTINSDAQVQYCMNGREVQGVNNNRSTVRNARFPELTKQIRQIVSAKALDIAKENYYEKYDELTKSIADSRLEIASKKKTTETVRSDDDRKYCIYVVEGQEPADIRNSSKIVEIKSDKREKVSVRSTYFPETGKCVKYTMTQSCDKYVKKNIFRKARCDKWSGNIKETSKEIVLK